MGKRRSKNLAVEVSLLENARADIEADGLEKLDQAEELARQIESIMHRGVEKSRPKETETKGFRRRPPGWDLPLPEVEENLN